MSYEVTDVKLLDLRLKDMDVDECDVYRRGDFAERQSGYQDTWIELE